MTKTLLVCVLVAGCGADPSGDDSIVGTWEFTTDGDCGLHIDQVEFSERDIDTDGDGILDPGLAIHWLPTEGGPIEPWDGNQVVFSIDHDTSPPERLAITMMVEPLLATVSYEVLDDGSGLYCENDVATIVPVKVEG